MLNVVRRNLRRLFKLLIFLLLEVFLFFIVNNYLSLITITDFKTTFLIIVFLSILNAILWPTISYISLRFIVFTLGFGTFLIDGFLLWLMSSYLGGFQISGWSLFIVPLIIGLINSLLSILLSVDMDESYYQRILRNQLSNEKITKKDGYLFIEIDGLAKDVLTDAIDKGHMPHLKKLIESTHKLLSWQTDLSSQTGASQAGILHGNNENIVAFRWVEKENDNRIVSSNSLADAGKIEKRISNRKGLLSDHGASRSNLFSGDAEDYLLTYSKLKNFYSKSWYYLYSTPYFIARLLLLFVFDMLMEATSRIRQLITNKKPRIHRGLKYFIARAGANVVMREASTYSLIGDIYAGKYNVIYSTYMGYDEIAHHSGIRDFDSFYALRQIDKQFKHILYAIDHSNRKYNVVILSDHGQSQGPTFKQKYGKTLDELVRENIPETMKIHSILHSNDDHLLETIKLKSYMNYNKERITKRIDNTKDNIAERIDNTKDSITNRFDNSVENISERVDISKEQLSNIKLKARNKLPIDEFKTKKVLINGNEPIIDKLNKINNEYSLDVDLTNDKVITKNDAQSIVLASGNLGLIYFTDWGGRMTYEQIEDAFPDLITNLANHPGIGFVLVKSALYGSIVLSDDNVYYLDDNKLVGQDFLKVYGKNIIKQLKRTDNFKHVPDILVNSTYDVENDEVYAFEELIGSHGGAGGTQQEPFILCPRDWSDPGEIFGAQKVYKFFKENINMR